MRRWLAIAVWAYATWILLSWTRTAEQLIFGAVLAGLVGLALSPLGPVLHPWRLFEPRRLWVVLRIGALVVVNMIRANISLSRLIWSPRLKRGALQPGMVVVPTEVSSEGSLTAVGVLTSLIVDNQIIDVARDEKRLQYHGVVIESDDPQANRDQINGSLEGLLKQLHR